MPLFRRKPNKLTDAEWFTDPNNPPRGVVRNPEGGFYVETGHGHKTPVVLGDWIAKEPYGNGHYPIKNQVMVENFEEIKLTTTPLVESC